MHALGQTVFPSRVQLSKREIEVLSRIAGGLTSKQTADELFVAKSTVDYHLENIYRKLGVNNRINAIRAAVNLGFLPRESAYGGFEVH
jgi:DNA-binding CsgD family transcriptional regulator